MVLIIFLLQTAKSIVIPLFFGLLISFMLLPLTKVLEHHKFPRSLAALTTLLIFILLVGIVT
ncbi:MAG TPA: hypothetical protein VD772_01435, partial [Anseongella sp.]|nr:hypothetical protein [Anseongella sp.]